MPQVKWLPKALTDIERLYQFLYDKDVSAASKEATVILHGAQLLGTTPHIGKPMPDESGRRELFMAYGAGSYVLRYMQLKDDAVVIIRVWHSREDRL